MSSRHQRQQNDCSRWFNKMWKLLSYVPSIHTVCPTSPTWSSVSCWGFLNTIRGSSRNCSLKTQTLTCQLQHKVNNLITWNCISMQSEFPSENLLTLSSKKSFRFLPLGFSLGGCIWNNKHNSSLFLPVEVIIWTHLAPELLQKAVPHSLLPCLCFRIQWLVVKHQWTGWCLSNSSGIL